MRAETVRSSWMAGVLAALVGLGSPIASAFTGPDPADAGAGAQAAAVAVADAPEPSPGPPTQDAVPDPDAPAPNAPRPAGPAGSLLVRVPHDMAVRANPSRGARSVGTLPSGSKYYGEPITAWVEEVSPDGRWGRVEIPYVWPRRHGWIALRGLARRSTGVEVRVDLSEHRITVTKRGRALFGIHLGHPALAARGLDRREPARDPRNERSVVDRTLGERRVPAGE
jgi:hypothetical protein